MLHLLLAIVGSQFNTRDESNDKVKHPNTFWAHITILRSLHTVTHSTHKIETTRLSWGLWTLNNRSGYLPSALRTKNLSLVHPLFKLNSVKQFRVVLRSSPSLYVYKNISPSMWVMHCIVSKQQIFHLQLQLNDKSRLHNSDYLRYFICKYSSRFHSSQYLQYLRIINHLTHPSTEDFHDIRAFHGRCLSPGN